MPKTSATAILLAAGRSRRMGRGTDKLFLPLGGKPVLFHSLKALQRSPLVQQVLLTCNQRNRGRLEQLVRRHRFTKVKAFVRGGAERSDSVALALEKIGDASNWVIIHDGARPMLNERMIRDGLSLARKRGSAVIASKVVDTIKKVNGRCRVKTTVDRRDLYSVQTPQIFRRSLILNAYRHVRKKNLHVTDDAAALEARGGNVYLYEYDGPNLKITRRQDLPLAEVLMRQGARK
jgi:2-C-methyl-D-erythritol 4-phosphate cytidylyltransferase